MTSPDVSIVVCTRNCAGLLQGALASLYDLAIEDGFSYEIVVVDRGSTDETQQVIATAAAQAKHPVRGIVETASGMVAARNRGIREARGRWIAFFGDDQLADWHWLAELYRGAVERKCSIVGGSVELALPAGCKRELAPEVRMLLGEPLGEDVPQPFGDDLVPGASALLIQRSVFDKIGLYEEAPDGRNEAGDHFDRIQRAGIEAWYVPTATIHQLTPSQRLERDYLLDLAGVVGSGEAIRERKSLGLVRFTCRWLQRWAQLMVIEYPRLAWAALRRNAEYSLACRCQLSMTRGYLAGACSSAVPKPAEPNPAPDLSPVSAAAGPATQLPPPAPAPAAAFSLRSAEPTAVMEFPPFSVGSPGSGSH